MEDVIVALCSTMEDVNNFINHQKEIRDDTWHMSSVDVCDIVKSEVETVEQVTNKWDPIKKTTTYNYIFLVVLTFQQDEEYL
jgi:hypothetical protein